MKKNKVYNLMKEREILKYDSKKDTIEHINNVAKFIEIMFKALMTRADYHDNSKLSSPEKEIFDIYTPKLKGTTYGSDEYKKYLTEMNIALKHHYSENRHHPEHFEKYVCTICYKEYENEPEYCEVCKNGDFEKESDISQMNLIDIMEMICDWKAATLRHADGDINKSIVINSKRFKISEQLKKILQNTVNDYLGG